MLYFLKIFFILIVACMHLHLALAVSGSRALVRYFPPYNGSAVEEAFSRATVH